MSFQMQTLCLYELAVVSSDSAPFVKTIGLNTVVQLIESNVIAENGKVLNVDSQRGLVTFPSATSAAKFATQMIGVSVQSPQGELSFRMSLTSGEGDLEDDPENELFRTAERLNKIGSSGEAILDQTTFLMMDRDDLPWIKRPGINEAEFPSLENLISLVGEGVCQLHSSIVEVLGTQPSKIIIRTPSSSMDIPKAPDAKTHIIYSGFKLNSAALDKELTQIPSMLVSTNIWIQVPKMAYGARYAWHESGKGLIISTDDALLEAIATAKLSSGASLGSATVMGMDLLDSGDLNLETTGVALPMVPLQGLIHGYSFDMLSSGDWGFSKSSGDTLFKIDIEPEGVFLSTTRQDVTVSGRGLRYGQRLSLRDGALIRTLLGTLRYVAFSGNYCGIIIGITSNIESIGKGERFEIGREPNHPGLALPVRGGEDRIIWMNSSKAKRAKQSGWTWDRSWVGRRQTMVQVTENDELLVSPIHERLPTLLYSNSKLIPLSRQTKANYGDMVIIGTTVFSLARP